METNITKEIKKEVTKYLVGFIGSVLIAGTIFYFNTSFTLSAHESQLNQLQKQIESKADQGAVEKRLDRIENKIDNLIELQITRNQIPK